MAAEGHLCLLVATLLPGDRLVVAEQLSAWSLNHAREPALLLRLGSEEQTWRQTFTLKVGMNEQETREGCRAAQRRRGPEQGEDFRSALPGPMRGGAYVE